MQLGELMLTKQKFTRMIEDTVQSHRLSYMDAIIHLCEKNNMEIEDIKKYISDPIKEKVEAEASKLNFLPRGNELPL
tara:strand:+ start:6654 stop:6884 length:231 start_codon:yes stop_codon:yes gene_type:complete